MKLISPKLEQALIREKLNPINTLDARKALEDALIYQFSKLADGLLAHLVLQDSGISKLKWWYHYLSQIDDVPLNYYPDFENSAFISFVQQLAQDIAAGQIKALTPADLNSIKIRIFGGDFGLWDDVRINRQLAYLGSSLRLAFVGSRNLALNRIQAILGKEVSLSKVDARFILGSVAPVTAFPIALTFDFEREFAVSPYLADWGGGFNYERRIAIRRTVIRIEVEDWLSDKPSVFDKILVSNSGSNRLSLKDYIKQDGFQRTYELHCQMALWHEMGHGTPEFGYSYLKCFWRDDIKRDICRFAQTPRSLQEIQETMKWGFEFPQKDLMEKYSKEIPPILALPTFETILEEMKSESLIVETVDGKLHCPTYENGKGWTIL